MTVSMGPCWGSPRAGEAKADPSFPNVFGWSVVPASPGNAGPQRWEVATATVTEVALLGSPAQPSYNGGPAWGHISPTECQVASHSRVLATPVEVKVIIKG